MTNVAVATTKMLVYVSGKPVSLSVTVRMSADVTHDVHAKLVAGTIKNWHVAYNAYHADEVVIDPALNVTACAKNGMAPYTGEPLVTVWNFSDAGDVGITVHDYTMPQEALTAVATLFEGSAMLKRYMPALFQSRPVTITPEWAPNIQAPTIPAPDEDGYVPPPLDGGKAAPAPQAPRPTPTQAPAPATEAATWRKVKAGADGTLMLPGKGKFAGQMSLAMIADKPLVDKPMFATLDESANMSENLVALPLTSIVIKVTGTGKTIGELNTRLGKISVWREKKDGGVTFDWARLEDFMNEGGIPFLGTDGNLRQGTLWTGQAWVVIKPTQSEDGKKEYRNFHGIWGA